ncbi:MAG: Unknown protein, partial [uncultured Sulfurovum sp.]
MKVKNNILFLSAIATTLLATTGCTSTSATSTKAISVAPIATQKANLMAQTTNDGSFSLPDAKSGMCYG